MFERVRNSFYSLPASAQYVLLFLAGFWIYMFAISFGVALIDAVWLNMLEPPTSSRGLDVARHASPHMLVLGVVTLVAASIGGFRLAGRYTRMK